MRVVLITGCSSGIGFETANLLSKNYLVYATTRNRKMCPLKEGKNLKLIQMNIDNFAQVKEKIKQIFKQSKRIDVLINNAGYGLIGSLDSLSIRQIQNAIKTNFLAHINLIKNVIPIMKKQQSGIIINISSIAGVIGSKGMSIYCSGKFALEGLSESLYEELKNEGIKLKIVEPGYTKTNFKDNIMRGKAKIINNKKRKQYPEDSKDTARLIENIIRANDSSLRYPTTKKVRDRIEQKLKNAVKTDYILNKNV